MSAGVVVIGPSRSGTSLVAGLFAQHGVFFGDCIDPEPKNPKGFFENRWLRSVTADPPKNWPDAWFDEMIREGWLGHAWGAKTGPENWPLMQRTNPSVVVLCWRPLSQILDSRQRIQWPGNGEAIVRVAWDRMSKISKEADCLVVHCCTDKLAGGDFGSILPAFERIGVEFNDSIAQKWVEPHLWHR